MKNKKGFTLIELIVTFSLMLSILGMAIISFISISNKKKQESYESIKKQIIVAAQEYFDNNSYYKESLTDSNFIKVSLGTLVDEDYLNVVNNPVTGKKLDYCNYVKVNKDKKDGGLDYKFFDDEIDCSSNSYVEVTETSAPIINITISGKKGNDNWYVYNTDKEPNPVITVEAYDKRFGISGDIQLKTDSGYAALETNMSSDKKGEVFAIDKSSYSKTTNYSGKKTCYRAVNSAGVSTTSCINLKVDIDKPNCEVYVIGISNGVTTVDDKTIYNYKQLGTIDLLAPKPIIKLSYSDNGSGVNEKTIKIQKPNSSFASYNNLSVYNQSDTKGEYVNWKGKLEDKAGNTNTCGKYISVSEEKTLVEEIIENANIKYCGETKGESKTWTNDNRTITQEFKSLSIKGITSNTKTETYNKTTQTATIKDGNTSCPVNVYVDKEKPYFTKIEFEREGYVYLTQWDSKGNVVINNEPIKITKNSNGKYTGQACVKNLVGKFNVTGYSVYARDDHSGINNNSWEKHRTYYSLNKNTWIGAQCLRTQKDNPCMMYDHIYVSDNAGNRSDDMGMLEIKVGYIGVDAGC